MKKAFYIENEDVSLDRLKSWEIELVKILKEAVKISGLIYSKQIDPVTQRGNFYPEGVTAQELEVAAKADPEILSAYTMIVKGSKKGELKAIKYHEFFKDDINDLVQILEKAKEIYKDNDHSEYSKYIEILINDFKKSEYTESEIFWLNIRNDSRVGIKIGPIETYQDKLLGIKRSFQGNLRIIDEEAQTHLKDYIDVINSIIPSSPFAIDAPEISFHVRIDKVIAMGGWHAELEPRSSNYPSDSNHIKNGIKALIYTNNIEQKVPIIRAITTEMMNIDMNDFTEMKIAAVRAATFHEISETIAKLKYYSEYKKLKHMRDKLVEAHANLTGIKSGSIQVLKGVISIEEYQYILLNFLAMALRGWSLSKTDKALSAYGHGYKVALNYFFENNAISLDENGKLDIDFPNLYSSIDSLSTKISQILMNGDLKEAEILFQKYSYENELLQIKPTLDRIVLR